MRITEVETIMLRLPQVADVCDGSQDAFVVRIHTDAGFVGMGEADSMPTILKAIYERRRRTRSATACATSCSGRTRCRSSRCSSG